MKKIYFLFLFCVFGQVLSGQNLNQDDGNVYALVFGPGEGFNCGGTRGWCSMGESEASRNRQSHKISGNVWFDRYGRLMLELNKNSLSRAVYDDIYQDGLLSLPFGLYLPNSIIEEENLMGIVEKVSAGDYLAIDKDTTVLVVLGKMN